MNELNLKRTSYTTAFSLLFPQITHHLQPDKIPEPIAIAKTITTKTFLLLSKVPGALFCFHCYREDQSV